MDSEEIRPIEFDKVGYAAMERDIKFIEDVVRQNLLVPPSIQMSAPGLGSVVANIHERTFHALLHGDAGARMRKKS